MYLSSHWCCEEIGGKIWLDVAVLFHVRQNLGAIGELSGDCMKSEIWENET